MDTQFISAVMAEQLRLNTMACDAKHQLEMERLLHKLEKEKLQIEIAELHEQLNALRTEKEELKTRRESLCQVPTPSVSVSVNSEILQELRRVREDVNTNEVIPYHLLGSVNDDEKTVTVDEKIVTVDDKKAKRREYAKEYMKRKRDTGKATSEQE